MTRARKTDKSSVKSALEALKKAKAGEEKRSDQLDEDNEEDDDDIDDDGDDLHRASTTTDLGDTIGNIEKELEKKRKNRDFVVDDDEFGYRERSDGEDEEVDDYSGEEAEVKGVKRTLKKKKTTTPKTPKDPAAKKVAAPRAKKAAPVVPEANRMDQFLNRSSAKPAAASSTSMKANIVKSKATDDLELYLNDLNANPNQEMDTDTIAEEKFKIEQREKQEAEAEAARLEALQMEALQAEALQAEAMQAEIEVKNEDDNVEQVDQPQDDDDFVFDFEDTPVAPVVVAAAAPVRASAPAPARPIKLQLTSPKLTNDWWSKTGDNVVEMQKFEDICVKDIAQVATIKNADGLEFFYMTAEEETSGAYQGKVYLFGKVKLTGTQPRYVSACMIVEGLERNILLQPRPYMNDANGDGTTLETTDADVEKEVATIMASHKIKGHCVKKVTRSFCFDYKEEHKANPIGKYTFYKVSYPATYPALSNDITGRSFKAAYGVTSSPLELFLLKRKIMGPSWLRLKDMQPTLEVSAKISWCRFEGKVGAPKNVTVVPRAQAPVSPPLVVMALSTRALNTDPTEIVLVSAVVHEAVDIEGATDPAVRNNLKYMSIIRSLTHQVLPHDFTKGIESRHNLKQCSNERQLLTTLADSIMSVDPDVLTGHNIIGHDLDLLIHRMKDCKVANWSYLGKLRKTNFPRLSGGIGSSENTFQERQVVTGRLICDTYLLSKEILLKEKNYKLVELCKTQLNMDKPEINILAIGSYFDTAKKLNILLEMNETDCQVVFMLHWKLHFLPLTKSLTNTAGNLWTRSLASNRAERIEYLLLHSFYARKYVLPDKYKGSGPIGKKAAYSGGRVIEPKRGFYDRYVIALDFNSLYPSIIQEYNVCFSTVQRTRNDDGRGWAEAEPPNSAVEVGVMPAVLASLVESRRSVQAAIKRESNATTRGQLETRQLAIKLVANSMYGCLGYSYSRFYALPLAELVTRKGRENLTKAEEITTKTNYNVIYGDTDSLMVNTGATTFNEARTIGTELMRRINDSYKHGHRHGTRSCIEIKLDGIFKRMLLLRKKKYAALKEDETDKGLVTKLENKGLDIVRRDWCDLTKELGGVVLESMMASDGGIPALHAAIQGHLETVSKQLKANELPVEVFAITKTLTSAPEDYGAGETQPHVQVALAMKAAGFSVAQGDQVPYVITRGTDDWAKRARSPGDVATMAEIDVEWYLAQQILPPLFRITELVEIEESKLAEWLGMKGTKYNKKSNARGGAGGEDDLDGFRPRDVYIALEDDTRFKGCKRPTFVCPHCRDVTEFKGAQIVDGEEKIRGVSIEGLVCRKCMHPFPKVAMINQVQIMIRWFIRQHQDWKLNCVECQTSAREYRENSFKCTKEQCQGKMTPILSSQALLRQLDYFRRIFSLEGVKRAGVSVAVEDEELLKELENGVQSMMAKNKNYLYTLSSILTPLQMDTNYLATRPWLRKYVKVIVEMDNQIEKPKRGRKPKVVVPVVVPVDEQPRVEPPVDEQPHEEVQPASSLTATVQPRANYSHMFTQSMAAFEYSTLAKMTYEAKTFTDIESVKKYYINSLKNLFVIVLMRFRRCNLVYKNGQEIRQIAYRGNFTRAQVGQIVQRLNNRFHNRGERGQLQVAMNYGNVVRIGRITPIGQRTDLYTLEADVGSDNYLDEPDTFREFYLYVIPELPREGGCGDTSIHRRTVRYAMQAIAVSKQPRLYDCIIDVCPELKEKYPMATPADFKKKLGINRKDKEFQSFLADGPQNYIPFGIYRATPTTL
eukprot:gene18294-21889_t